MTKAVWNGVTLAESDKVETIEGNVYFPDEAVKREFFRPSSTTSSCTWKGQARYYTVVVDRPGKPGRGLVLSRSKARRSQREIPCGLLARCGSHYR